MLTPGELGFRGFPGVLMDSIGKGRFWMLSLGLRYCPACHIDGPRRYRHSQDEFCEVWSRW